MVVQIVRRRATRGFGRLVSNPKSDMWYNLDLF